MTEPQKFDRFYLRELLNSGGMSEIWLVADGRGKPYALRKLKRELRFNFTARRRFMHGCKVLEQLADKDNIVGYVEHGKAEGTCYLVMDYVEAENLKELYVRQDPLLAENVAQILIDAATGLSHVHEAGYMHLDFKPENILVTRNGAVRLIDFDMAQPMPEKPVKFSKNPGTPGYMAPEQLKHEGIDGRADIFAFGVSAYELLANQKPFPGETPGEILAAQMAPEGAVPLRVHNPDVPLALEKVIMKCIEREPDRRYPFCGIMLRDLQGALYI
ncbi:MAG: serine/threonine-protein kinase [Verrucomicrobiae bacterium]|nr:serine/threonine-protein kinase [Verrucomicrobiae bacterium]